MRAAAPRSSLSSGRLEDGARTNHQRCPHPLMLQAAVGTLLVCARQRRRWCGADQDRSRTTLGASLLRRTGGGRRRDAAPRSARAGASPAPRWRPTHRVRRLPLTSGAQADSRSGQDQSTSSGRDARPRHSTLCPYVTSAAHGAVAISGCGRVCTMRSIVGISSPSPCRRHHARRRPRCCYRAPCRRRHWQNGPRGGAARTLLSSRHETAISTRCGHRDRGCDWRCHGRRPT